MDHQPIVDRRGLATKEKEEEEKEKEISGQFLLTIPGTVAWLLCVTFRARRLSISFPFFSVPCTSTATCTFIGEGEGRGCSFPFERTRTTITHLDDALSIVAVIDLSLKSIHLSASVMRFEWRPEKTSLSPTLLF